MGSVINRCVCRGGGYFQEVGQENILLCKGGGVVTT